VVCLCYGLIDTQDNRNAITSYLSLPINIWETGRWYFQIIQLSNPTIISKNSWKLRIMLRVIIQLKWCWMILKSLPKRRSFSSRRIWNQLWILSMWGWSSTNQRFCFSLPKKEVPSMISRRIQLKICIRDWEMFWSRCRKLTRRNLKLKIRLNNSKLMLSRKWPPKK